MKRSLAALVVLFPVAVLAVTFGDQNKNRGLFGSNQPPSTTFGNGPATDGSRERPSAAPSPGRATEDPNALRDYGKNLSKSETVSLQQLQRATKQAGMNLGEITGQEHAQLSQCLFEGAADTAAAMAANCMDRTSQEYNRKLIALRFPDYANKMAGKTESKPQPH